MQARCCCARYPHELGAGVRFVLVSATVGKARAPLAGARHGHDEALFVQLDAAFA